MLATGWQKVLDKYAPTVVSVHCSNDDMASNSGTGHPISLKCAKCRGGHPAYGLNLVATGERKPLGRLERRGGVRMLDERIQYKCLDCGHVGWTRHVGAKRLKPQTT